MRIAGLLILLLAGCGGGPGGENAGISTNQIERLATAGPEPAADPQLQARPQPIAAADLQREGVERPACDFSHRGDMLLAATATDAVARVNGRFYHFTHSSQVGPTGGFFEDRQLSVSVGRTTETSPGTGRAGRWTARLTITNRRANAQVGIVGTWRCG